MSQPTPGRGMSVHCERVVLLYPSDEGEVAALRGIDLDIEGGEMLAILGPSSSGKSSLLAVLAGLLQPSSGRIWLGGRELAKASSRELSRMRAASVSLVLQDPSRNLLPYATGLQNLEFAQRLGRAHARGPLPDPLGLLRGLRLEQLAERLVSVMGGGEQQQLAIAASVALGPELLLLDEPTNQLDPRGRDEVLESLRAVNRQLGTTIVCVTHDESVAAALPRTVRIRDGLVGAEEREGQLFAVVAREGSVQLPEPVLEVLPPGSLVRVRQRPDGAELLRPDKAPPEG